MGAGDKVAVTAGDSAETGFAAGVDGEAASVTTCECGLLEHDKIKSPIRTRAVRETRITSLLTMLSQLLLLVCRNFRQDGRLQKSLLFFLRGINWQAAWIN